MSSSMKKRRVVGGGGSSGDNDIGGGVSVSEELKDIKSTMSAMLCMMKDMQGVMNSMQKDMNGMKKDITKLTKKCGGMEKSIKDIDETVDDVEETLDDMRKRQKYLKALLQNQKWEYSAPRPSEEYWNNLDDQEIDEDSPEEFLADIQKCTKEMRYGNGDGDIQIFIHAPGLLYNEELFPHWKEFANALRQYQYHQKCSHTGRITLLSLWGMELSDEVVDLLSRALESTYFEQFGLGGNRNFGEKVIKFALDYFENNDSCKRFTLHENPMNNMEDIKRLCKIVKEHPTITELSLCECSISLEMVKAIIKSGRKKLRAIDLGGNSISTGGDDTFISDFLANNKILRSLFIHDNQFNDDDALLIAGAMKYNTSLRVLDIGGNNVANIGWEALGKAVFDKTSLNSASDSNHTCTIGGNDLGSVNGNVKNQEVFYPVNIRQKKVYSILSARNRTLSNVDHFDDDMPVELLPNILTTIERYAKYHETNEEDDAPPRDSQDVKPLSVVFEILQRWDKSLAVFEALIS